MISSTSLTCLRTARHTYALGRSIDERSLVYFSDNPHHLLEAYVENGEGIDRAGGFAIQVSSSNPPDPEQERLFTIFHLQGQGGLLVRKIEGDYHNVVGFPAASFFRLLDITAEDEEDFMAI